MRVLLCLFAIALALPIWADGQADDDVAEQIKGLEHRMEALQRELAELKRRTREQPPNALYPRLNRKRVFQSPAKIRDSVFKRLDEPAAVRLDGNRFESVIEYFRNVSGVNMFVHWDAIRVAGVEDDTSVTLNMGKVPIAHALDMVLRLKSDPSGDPAKTIAWRVGGDGFVVISTILDFASRTFTRRYSLAALLKEKSDKQRERLIFDVQDALIRTVGHRKLWAVGGGPWELRVVDDQLFVKASDDAHDTIAELVATFGDAPPAETAEPQAEPVEAE